MSKKYLEDDDDFKWNDDLEWDERADEFDDSFDDVDDDRPKKKKIKSGKKTAKKTTSSKSGTKKSTKSSTKSSGQSSAKAAKGSAKKKTSAKKKKRRRILMAILAVLEVLALAVVGFALFVMNYFQNTMEEMNKPSGNQGPSFEIDNVDINDLDHSVLEKLEGYTTYAVLGLDQRSQADYTKGQSDVIVLLSVNNDTGEINMVSVYRDTFLQIDASGTLYKINAAYNRGGAHQALQALNTNLDLKIDHYVTVNWQAVAEIIDLMGGVEIEISETLFYAKDQHGGSLLNSYIYTTSVELDLDYEITYPTGPGYQTLNGAQAVGLCRIRGANLMDYGRTANQRQVVSQMFEKAKALVKKGNIPTLMSIVNTAVKYVETDVTDNDIYRLLPEIANYYLNTSDGFPFSDMRGGKVIESVGDCVVAKDLVTNVTRLHEVLYANETYVPSDTVLNLSQKISSLTGIYAN